MGTIYTTYAYFFICSHAKSLSMREDGTSSLIGWGFAWLYIKNCPSKTLHDQFISIVNIRQKFFPIYCEFQSLPQVLFRHYWHSWHCIVPCVNTLRPRQDVRHFPDNIFKCIFLNENAWILIKISLKFVPYDLINNIPALIQVMVWHRPGGKPLSEPMMVRLPMHICLTQPQWVNGNNTGLYQSEMTPICCEFHHFLWYYVDITDPSGCHSGLIQRQCAGWLGLPAWNGLQRGVAFFGKVVHIQYKCWKWTLNCLLYFSSFNYIGPISI